MKGGISAVSEDILRAAREMGKGEQAGDSGKETTGDEDMSHFMGRVRRTRHLRSAAKLSYGSSKPRTGGRYHARSAVHSRD